MKNFRYESGMYGGCFDPLHIGHVNIIQRAATECKVLFLVISISKKQDRIYKNIRCQWLYKVTKHLPNVVIIPVQHECSSKQEYDSIENWKRDAIYIRKYIANWYLYNKKVNNKNIIKQIDQPDVIYYSPSNCDDNTHFYNECYPNAKIISIDRTIINCSSTEIFNNPIKNWEFIPIIVRPYFVKKILFIGDESTGKTTIVQTLANIFNTNYVLETGRYIADENGGEVNLSTNDYIQIMMHHRLAIENASKYANKYLFIDTSLETTQFFAEYNKCKTMLEQHIQFIDVSYDMIFFLENDVPFINDGTRIYSRTLKEYYSQVYKDKFISINGSSYIERLNTCINLIKK